jgi:uroporphyrinogen-III synthase
MAKYKVLSTKKLEPSLVEQAEENTIEIIEQEAIKVQPILSKEKWQEIFQLIESQKEFAVFTSSNAVLALKKYLHDYINPFKIDWKLFSLSGKTKAALEENGNLFGTIIETAENSKDLARKIIGGEVNEVIFFCGNKRREELPTILNEAGTKVHEVVVYETVETPAIASEDIDAILFFSPSAVQSFFSVNQLKSKVVCFAIGQTTADSIANFISNRIVVSESSSQEVLLASVLSYFKNGNYNEQVRRIAE